MKFDYGIDERGKRKVVVRHRGKYLIFADTSKMLRFLHRNNATDEEFEKAMMKMDEVLCAREERMAKLIMDRNNKRTPSYIG